MLLKEGIEPDFEVRIDPDSREPVYRQIAEQLKSKIIEGVILPGQSLPTVRQLADRLSVSNFTVLHAYGLLQQQNLIESTIGRGTVVSKRAFREQGEFLIRQLAHSGPFNAFEDLSEAAGIRSLATACPDPALFHADEFWAELYALGKGSHWQMYYSPPHGEPELISAVQNLLRKDRIIATPSHVVITSGSTHAMTLAVDVVCDPGDTVLVESPSFLGSESFFAHRRVRPIPVPRTAEGFDIDAILALIKKHRPKCFILSPSYSAPTGYQLSYEQREAIAQIANDQQIFVLENESFSRIRYDGDALPPITAFGRGSGRVIHIGSFSYMLTPGLRLGYIASQINISKRIADRLRAQQLSLCRFTQLATASYLKNGSLDTHLQRVLPKYRLRRDAMLQALETSMPAGTQWSWPEGGFSTWVELPAGRDYSKLYQQAVEHGTAFAGGGLFLGCHEKERCMRLTFGMQSTSAIQEAVRILGKLVESSPTT
ncbi:MAG: PLP-dependent aminotransferase family protein [Fimbriimonadaceae bacterium]|nr:PLP-dependent aminotransferase family protein [Fimbriimonadaceae bacterium]